MKHVNQIVATDVQWSKLGWLAVETALAGWCLFVAVRIFDL